MTAAHVHGRVFELKDAKLEGIKLAMLLNAKSGVSITLLI